MGTAITGAPPARESAELEALLRARLAEFRGLRADRVRDWTEDEALILAIAAAVQGHLFSAAEPSRTQRSTRTCDVSCAASRVRKRSAVASPGWRVALSRGSVSCASTAMRAAAFGSSKYRNALASPTRDACNGRHGYDRTPLRAHRATPRRTEPPRGDGHRRGAGYAGPVRRGRSDAARLLSGDAQRAGVRQAAREGGRRGRDHDRQHVGRAISIRSADARRPSGRGRSAGRAAASRRRQSALGERDRRRTNGGSDGVLGRRRRTEATLGAGVCGAVADTTEARGRRGGESRTGALLKRRYLGTGGTGRRVSGGHGVGYGAPGSGQCRHVKRQTRPR